MAGRQFWLIAGANGAGKTSIASKPYFRRLLSYIPILNPDVVTLEILERQPDLALDEANRLAAEETERNVDAAIGRGAGGQASQKAGMAIAYRDAAAEGRLGSARCVLRQAQHEDISLCHTRSSSS